MTANNNKSRKENASRIDWSAIHQRLEEIERMIHAETSVAPGELQDILEQRARQLSRIPPAEEKGEMLRVATFVLAEELYAVEVSYVTTIRPLEHLTMVPCVPDFVIGVVNLRGRVISVIDIRKFFGITATQLTDLSQMLVIQAGGHEVGIVAEQVLEVILLRRADLEPPPATVTGILAEYIQGITKTAYQDQTVPLTVLDLDALFRDKRVIVHEEVG